MLGLVELSDIGWTISQPSRSVNQSENLQRHRAAASSFRVNIPDAA
jgi:hypothetical protein